MDVADDTSGDYKRLLLERLRCARSEETTLDEQSAKELAERLFAAGEDRWGTTESVFIEIFTRWAAPHPGYIRSCSHPSLFVLCHASVPLRLYSYVAS